MDTTKNYDPTGGCQIATGYVRPGGDWRDLRSTCRVCLLARHHHWVGEITPSVDGDDPVYGGAFSECRCRAGLQHQGPDVLQCPGLPGSPGHAAALDRSYLIEPLLRPEQLTVATSALGTRH